MKTTMKFVAAVFVAVLVATPMFAARGSANFTNFVALGDSYGAGFESGSLNERHQPWSWPAVIARQVGYEFCPAGQTAPTPTCFAQPLVSFPGIGPELQLNAIVPTASITPAPGLGTPLMTGLQRPYNNLSIPGATVGALLTLTGAEPPSQGEATAVTMARFILRGQGTAVAQAVRLNPTFIALWIGGNDYLNVMFSGNPATITSAADFKARYEAVLDALIAGAPNAGMVVGNLPTGIPPYLRLVPAFLVNPATGLPVEVGGQRVYYIVKNADGTETPIAADTLIPLQTRDRIAQGYGLPAFLKAVPPFSSLPHVGEALTPNDVITSAELQQVITRVGEYNAAINAAAAARNIPVADVAGLFNRVVSPTGERLGPITVTGAPVTGGFFSFDFFHLTDLGYLLMGNEFIKAINAGYDTEIPLASITQLFANNGAFFSGDGVGASSFNVSSEAVEQIRSFWTPAPATPRRGRAISH
jgi:hypothetical protein